MNIFILNTGRCGSSTFIKACQHINNYSSAHESRIHLLSSDRLDYPANHIEADNRLSWFLGKLEQNYGNKAYYVHLKRNKGDTARSFAQRKDFGILKAYREGILLADENCCDSIDLATDYIETVEANIELFLANKTEKMQFLLENAKADFQRFWKAINAQGNLDDALSHWDITYNASADR